VRNRRRRKFATSGIDTVDAVRPADQQPAGEVVLLRHGTTQWSADGKHTGRTDVPLTHEGERQAAAVQPALAERKFALILSSPLVRARRTAELAGLHDIQIDPNLQEWDYGQYEGLTTAQIRERKPGWSLWRDGVRSEGVGGGESAAEVGNRADAVIMRAVGSLDAGDVLLVSHGHFLRVLAARWLELPPADGSLLALDTASLSVLGFEHGYRVIRHWNQLPGDEPAAS
jgi:broad specificity phosphatase PhoE